MAPVTVLFGFGVCVIVDVEGAHTECVVRFGGCLANVRVTVVFIIIIGVSCKFLDMFNIIEVRVKNDVARMQRDARGNTCGTDGLAVRNIKVWFVRRVNIMMPNVVIMARTRGMLTAAIIIMMVTTA